MAGGDAADFALMRATYLRWDGTPMHVERMVDRMGCTVATASYEHGFGHRPTSYIRHESHSLDSYIVAHGQAYLEGEPGGPFFDDAEINGPDAVRVFAADPDSALVLAELYDAGHRQPSNVSRGQSVVAGIVQIIGDDYKDIPLSDAHSPWPSPKLPV